MNQNSRSKNVVYNIAGGVGGQIFTSVLQFVCRTVFISLLGATYLGVNGLFANILSMLSLAELGIGPAIVFSMYKPIADHDEVHIAKLMNFYKLAYRIVAIVVLAIGLGLTPFLDFFIQDTTGIENLRLIFVLIVLNTVVSYLYAYKGSMLNADQKAYVVVIIRNIFAVIQNIVQILMLVLTGNYLIYLIVQIITTFLGNYFLSKYVDKMYPFLVKYSKEKISKEERTIILQKVRGMMVHKLGGFVLNSTDNLIISKFIGVVVVGLYSNYLLIINMIKAYLTQVTGSMTASVGNLIANESKDKVYRVFNAMLLVYFWIYGFCFICFYVIFQPFICLWIGEDFLLSNGILLLIVVNFYLNGFQDCVNTYINATGLFWETRKKPIIECLINLSVSIALAYKIGLAGVFIGTIVSFILTFWINPVVLYKNFFGKSVFPYFVKFIGYFLVCTAIALGLDAILTMWLTVSVFWNVVIRIILCLIVSNGLFWILFHKSDGYVYCRNIVYSLFNKLLKKRNSNK